MSARVLHCDGKWQTDAWRVARDGHDAPHGGPRLLPLASWLAGDPGSEHGVWLAPADDPSALVAHFARVRLVAVDFPTFTDGRGYSIATLLRRLGYRGELRAIGDVLVDQLFMLKRVGFTLVRAARRPGRSRRRRGTADLLRRLSGRVGRRTAVLPAPRPDSL